MAGETQTYLYDMSEGNAQMRALLGGKGANLAEMKRLGIPVPDGFTVSTAACIATTDAGGEWPPGLWEDVLASPHAAGGAHRTHPGGASGRCCSPCAPAPWSPCPG